MASLVGGAALGAPFSELLRLVIEEAKKVKAFKSSFKELVSTMERLIPIVAAIDSLYGILDLQRGELKILIDTITKAQTLVQECRLVWKLDFYSKARYTRKIKKIDQDLLKYCQIDLHLLLSRNQLQTMDAIKRLSERMDHISLVGNNVGKPCSPPAPEMVTVGLDLPLMELKKTLFVDGTSAVVVSAPPGCGKTTLVTKLCHDEEVKRRFKSIFFVVVSKTPNMRLIIQKLIQHNGYIAPAFENDLEAIIFLQQLLTQIGQSNPILLVLDDVWQGAESLLEKFVVQLPDYKILVTSRFAFPSFGSTYRLETLKDEDARSLLIKWASQPVGISCAEYEDLLEKVLKHCNGYPLVIKVVGRSLKNRSLTAWKNLLIKWSEGDKIINTSDQDVLDCLKTSVEALETDLKECFLDLGSFLEDQKIRALTIVDIWVELYGLDKDGVRAMKFLEDLSFQNLLKLFTLGRNDHEIDFYHEYIVTQHDILRELAIHQSELEAVVERKRLNVEIRGDRFPDWYLNLRQPVNARLLSISTDESFSSKWCEMNFPTVEALVLNFFTSNYVLPGFIAKMERLKVLTATNHSFFPAKVGNFSSIGSLSDLRRIRLEKVSIASMDIGQLQLRSLEKLSLLMCNIGEVFYDFQTDVSSALPRLQEIEIDYCNDLEELPYWICEVVSLKKLSITNCNKLSKLPESIGNLSNLEVLRLTSCINLSELPETIEGLKKLCHLDISECLSLKKLPPQIGKLQKLKKISMRKCSSCELPKSIKNLENLEVKCDEETAFLWEQFRPILNNLTINVLKGGDDNLNWLEIL